MENESSRARNNFDIAFFRFLVLANLVVIVCYFVGLIHLEWIGNSIFFSFLFLILLGSCGAYGVNEKKWSKVKNPVFDKTVAARVPDGFCRPETIESCIGMTRRDALKALNKHQNQARSGNISISDKMGLLRWFVVTWGGTSPHYDAKKKNNDSMIQEDVPLSEVKKIMLEAIAEEHEEGTPEYERWKANIEGIVDLNDTAS